MQYVKVFLGSQQPMNSGPLIDDVLHKISTNILAVKKTVFLASCYIIFQIYTWENHRKNDGCLVTKEWIQRLKKGGHKYRVGCWQLAMDSHHTD